jgi:hypothetical protein
MWVFHPSDEDLSLGTPVLPVSELPSNSTFSWRPIHLRCASSSTMVLFSDGIARKSVRMLEVHRQVVRLLLHTRNHHRRLAEVRLRLARRVRQGHKHLPVAQHRHVHVVLHHRVTARELMLFALPLEDPLRSVPLLRRPLSVVVQNGIDDAYPWPRLGTRGLRAA